MQTAATLRPRYERFDLFLSIRDRFDPERRFANAYLTTVLGPDSLFPPSPEPHGPV